MSNEYYLHRYSDMVRDGHKRTLKNAINLILPKIDDIEMLTDDTDHSYLSAMTDTGVRLPLHALGGGVVHIYHLLLSLFAAQGGILLVDEMENGIHHSVLQEIWSYTRRWIHEWNVQFLATTHSAECIDAAMDAFADAPGDLSIHKLFMNSETGRIEAATYTDEALEGARDLHLEVR